MKGAFIVADDSLLGEHLLSAMRNAHAVTTADGLAQISDREGRMFSVFTRDLFQDEREWRNDPNDSPHEIFRGMHAPTACWIECRWEELFSSKVKAIATELPVASWIVDGDGVLWAAAEVDPRRVRL